MQTGPRRRAESYKYILNSLGYADKKGKADSFIPAWQDSTVIEMRYLSRKGRMQVDLFSNSFEN